MAKETGDIILLKDDIRDVVGAIEIGRATMRKIKQNLGWAFVYNITGIPLAAGILYPFTGFLVSPELASFFMALSSISVTMNTLLLKRSTKGTFLEIVLKLKKLSVHKKFTTSSLDNLIDIVRYSHIELKTFF